MSENGGTKDDESGLSPLISMNTTATTTTKSTTPSLDPAVVITERVLKPAVTAPAAPFEEENDPAAAMKASEKAAEADFTSPIHGIGLWNSWTRNFSSPLLAIWDLLDNSFDAAEDHNVPDFHKTLKKKSSIHIDPDHSVQNPELRGIVMRNTCVHPILPLTAILKAYNSSKASKGDVRIGENGVGIKQGCATLSDLSFVLTRNHLTGKYGFGILALELQSASGIYLPSFELNGGLEKDSMLDLLGYDLDSICDSSPKIANVIARYGGAHPPDGDYDALDSDVYDRCFQQGKEQLLSHYGTLANPNSYARWGQDHHVFCLILHDLKHNSQRENQNLLGPATPEAKDAFQSVPDVTKNSNTYTSKLRNGESTPTAVHSSHQRSSLNNAVPVVVSHLMSQIKQELPRRYLHVDDRILDVQVNRQVVPFSYWQRRLVELTHFRIQVNDRFPYFKGPQYMGNALAPRETFEYNKQHEQRTGGGATQNDDDDDDNGRREDKHINEEEKKSSFLEEGDDMMDTDRKRLAAAAKAQAPPNPLDKHFHYMNVYLGFDALRDNKSPLLLWHSRRSGRLIRANKDARGELAIVSGSSFFCQGLTIIVDDIDSALPLNPTKQDFAFGERAHGEIHHTNIVQWVSSVVKFYYNYHLRNADMKKTLLSDRVRMMESKAIELVRQETIGKLGDIADLLASSGGIEDMKREIKPMLQCEFSYFEELEWYLRGDRLCHKSQKKSLKLAHGSDTLMRLPDRETLPKENGGAVPDIDEDEDGFDPHSLAAAHAARRRSDGEGVPFTTEHLSKAALAALPKGSWKNSAANKKAAAKMVAQNSNAVMLGENSEDDSAAVVEVISSGAAGPGRKRKRVAGSGPMASLPLPKGTRQQMVAQVVQAREDLDVLGQENTNLKEENDHLKLKLKKRKETIRMLLEQVSVLKLELDMHKSKREHYKNQIAFMNRKYKKKGGGQRGGGRDDEEEEEDDYDDDDEEEPSPIRSSQRRSLEASNRRGSGGSGRRDRGTPSRVTSSGSGRKGRQQQQQQYGRRGHHHQDEDDEDDIVYNVDEDEDSGNEVPAMDMDEDVEEDEQEERHNNKHYDDDSENEVEEMDEADEPPPPVKSSRRRQTARKSAYQEGDEIDDDDDEEDEPSPRRASRSTPRKRVVGRGSPAAKRGRRSYGAADI